MKKRHMFGMLLLISLFFVYGCAQEATLTLEELQVCSEDSHCTYTDNSCCPMTDAENLVAINAEYEDEYDAMGPECDEEVICSEEVIEPQNVGCVEGLCSFTGY